MNRRYRLEANPALTGGVWTSVPGYTNIVGGNEMVAYLTAGGGKPGLFRGEISLQGFSIPPSVILMVTACRTPGKRCTLEA